MKDRIALYRSLVLFSLIVLSLLGYVYMGFVADRHMHLELNSVYFLLVASWIGIYFLIRKEKRLVRILFLTGLAARLIFIPSTPRLSDDFYRYKWDGFLQTQGYSPYSFLPNEYLDNVNSEEVRAFSIKYNDRDNNFPKGMNSRQYYSIYPFTVQPLFGLAALTENADWKGQFSLHIFLIFFEILTFIFLRKLIALLSMNPVVIALYWLNPLIIIELVGNLHTEGFAICFILIAIWYLLKEKIPAFVLAIVLAIGAKLTPLLILPALFRSVPFRGFFALSLSVVILSVLSLVFSVGIENLPNFWKSFLLYFETFEFNAGIYYALNDFMFTLTKVNYADKISVLLTIVFISSAIGIGWRKNSDGFIKRFLLIYAAYFLLAQVVNPWYIALLIPIGILSRMLFPLIWGVIVWGSYTAYTPSGVEENHLFVILQFCLILILYTLEQKGKLTKLKRVIYPFASE